MLLRIICTLILFFFIQRMLKFAGFTEDKKIYLQKLKDGNKDEDNNKESFINKEIKDRGVGTFGSLQFTYDKEKRKEKSLYDISNLKPIEIKNTVDQNKEERVKIFNEYKRVKDVNSSDYDETQSKNLKVHLDSLDTYIDKMSRIY